MSNSPQDIFGKVCDLQPPERLEAIDRLCGDDAKLRSEVETLLSAFDQAGDFLNEPTIDPVVDQTIDHVAPESMMAEVNIAEGPGSVVDRYKLLEKIGEGGFGVVYMAQQTEPIKRRVALKIIKLGMDTKQVVARFEAERQALAMMDHPNIARVIDGGSTDTGRPFFVMELVRGDPITTYCDQRKLSLRDRLKVFQQVCAAIEHAHQKGIIHRDIKPSNVLVTIADDQPVVKVIDFGIAKATSTDLTNKTLFTEFRQLLGTPLYMSPEQAERSGVDVDTRTDVYSLGVLLYEVLTGRTPLDPQKLNSAAWGELQRMIVEEEPTKPSVLVTSSLNADLSELARLRRVAPTRLGQSLRGDLDWIVLKAIDKDRSRRYSTASQFAADIDRFLRDDPVEATPPSKIYQLRKFARRNRALLGTLSAVFLALIVGLVATSVSAAWAIRSERAAKQALQQATANERTARRAATLAGASLTLPETEARSMADSWQAEINDLAKDPSADQTDIVRRRTQFTTWFATWLLAHGHWDESQQLIDVCYDDAKTAVGLADPSFMALCNARVLVSDKLDDADPQVRANTFDDLIVSVRQIHGDTAALRLHPEYAAALVQAKRNKDAVEVVERYAEFRKQPEGVLSPSENMRLDVSIDRMMNANGDPKLISKLRSIRDVGSSVASEGSSDNDAELQEDLESMQGKWRYKGWKEGKLTEHMIVEIVGDESRTRWIDEDHKTIRGRTNRIRLGRSGRVKLFQTYLAAKPDDVGAFVYRINSHQLIIISGMLVNDHSLPTELRRFYRMKDGEED